MSTTDAMIAWLLGWLPAGATGAWAAGVLALLCLIVAVRLAREAVTRFFAAPDEETASAGPVAEIFNWLFPALWAVVVLALAVVFATVSYKQVVDYWDWVLAYVSVFLFGGAVGAAELISRYRDDPTRALWTMPGFFYIALNALGSLAALYLIYVYRDRLGFADSSEAKNWLPGAVNLVQAVLLAGFSSLLFFRASIFKFRAGDSDLAIGPAIVLDTLLGAADRAVDRVMASPRAAFVHRVMKYVIFEKAAAILPGHSLSLMQNVSSEESQRIAGVVNQLRTDKETPERVKVLNLGLALLSVVGERVLETAIKGLQDDLEDSTARLIEEIGDVMADVSFTTARLIVPPYCFAIAQTEVPEEVRQKLTFDMKALDETQGVPEAYKVLRLGIGLARLTNGAMVRKALRDLDKDIKRPPPPAPEIAPAVAPSPGGQKPAGADPAREAAGESRAGGGDPQGLLAAVPFLARQIKKPPDDKNPLEDIRLPEDTKPPQDEPGQKEARGGS